MKTIKTAAVLFFILLLATQPDEVVLWGVMLAACVGMYIAAERSEAENVQNNYERQSK